MVARTIIGGHAYHLAGYVSGLLPKEILAELDAFTPGRPLDDHVQVMLRYAKGARHAVEPPDGDRL